MTIDDLQIVNYCHPNCKPLQNIMRLPKEQAFTLAYEMAEANKETTAFYRFADFANYYPERLKTDELLYTRFIELGGRPLEKHPLSFVLQGSDFLDRWFDCGIVTRIPLSRIPEDVISFTYGDSMTILKKQGEIKMLTKELLLKAIDAFGTVEEFLTDVSERFRYIEVQVWDDECLSERNER